MYQGESVIAQPRSDQVIMPPTQRPKGLGRRNPHSGKFTRKTSETFDHAIKISNGLNKISMFFTGKSSVIKKPVISESNPFKAMMDKILNRKGK